MLKEIINRMFAASVDCKIYKMKAICSTKVIQLAIVKVRCKKIVAITCSGVPTFIAIKARVNVKNKSVCSHNQRWKTVVTYYYLF